MASSKKEPYNDLSETHKCERCGKPIKSRLVRIKQAPPRLCYLHWLEARGKAPRRQRGKP